MRLILIVFSAALLLGCASPQPPAAQEEPEDGAAPPAPEPQKPEPPPSISGPDPEQEMPQPPSVPEPAGEEPAPSGLTCSDGETVAFVMDAGRRISPAYGESVTCAGAFAIEKGGKRYFGCPEGKIILDCDWFVQNIGAENTTEDAEFGSNSLADFHAPEIPAECGASEPDEGMLETPGKACDLQTVAQAVNAQRLG
ncbi:MAG: hypothetical protein AB1324_03825 [Candidatus Micrarchaeota archaeon]